MNKITGRGRFSLAEQCANVPVEGECWSGLFVIHWLLPEDGSGFHGCTFTHVCSAWGDGADTPVSFCDPLKNPEPVNIFRAIQKQISSLYLAFSHWEFHLAFGFDPHLLNSLSATKSGGVNLLVSFLRTCEFAPENCSWAIPFSLPGMQLVSPMQLLNVLFFKLVTSRGMLHSNSKWQNFSL